MTCINIINSASHKSVSETMSAVVAPECPILTPDLIWPLMSHVSSFIHSFIFQRFIEPLLNSRP